MLLLTFALLDGAYSGDWTKYGLVSYATEDYLKAVAGTVLFGRACAWFWGLCVLGCDRLDHSVRSSVRPPHLPG